MWKSRSLALALSLALTITILVVLTVEDVLTPRVFGLCCIWLMAVTAVAWSILLARAKKAKGIEGTITLPHTQTRKSNIFLLIGIAVFFVRFPVAD